LGAAPAFGRVGLCRGSLFARPCAAEGGWVCGCAAPLSIPQPAAALPPARPKIYILFSTQALIFLKK